MLRPMIPQQPHDLGVVDTNRGLEQDQQLRTEPRPALAKNQIVRILDVQAGGAARDVERTQQLLDVEEADLPRLLLSCERIFESVGGAAMSAAGVVKNDDKFTIRTAGVSSQYFHTPHCQKVRTQSRCRRFPCWHPARQSRFDTRGFALRLGQ